MMIEKHGRPFGGGERGVVFAAQRLFATFGFVGHKAAARHELKQDHGPSSSVGAIYPHTGLVNMN